MLNKSKFKKNSPSVLLCALLALMSMSALAKIPRPGRALTSCEDFITHDEVGALFEMYEEQLPQIAKAFSIGTSVGGREIWALLVSASPDEETAEPEIRIVGGIHGNECMSVELVVELIEAMLGGYGDDQFYSDLIDGAEVVFIPLINPDGYCAEEASRENDNGIDLNRNFGFAWVGRGDEPFSEPETRAVRDLSIESSFNLGISYHTVADYVNSPWNYTPSHPPDEELFAEMGAAYAGGSGYNVVFGWDWYGIYGDLNDWSYGSRGTFDWTIEMRSDLEMEWSVHEDGVVHFLSYALGGVSGLVTDAQTGQPLLARIDIWPEGAPVFTDSDIGDYHRIVLPGMYSVTASAPGFEPQGAGDVEITDEGAVELNFALERKPFESNEYAFQVERMTLPQEIGFEFVDIEYLNDTMAWDALGAPDRWPYCLSPGGSITLDMGEAGVIEDVDGPDLVVVSATNSEDPADILLAADRDGPFRWAASGEGDIAIDIADAQFQAIRFVRVVDRGEDAFNYELAGYDLDAIVNITRAPYVPLEPIIEPVYYTPGGCHCQSVAKPNEAGLIHLMFSLWVS